jgi:hypothetical protein
MRGEGFYIRAFVLQIDPGCDVAAGEMFGSVENVATCRSTQFATLCELKEFIELIFTEKANLGVKTPDNPIVE